MTTNTSPQAGRGSLLKGMAMMMLSALSVFLVFPRGAWAQSVAPDLNQIMGATGADDWSMSMWRLLLGSFADSPFGALGAPDSLLGAIFLIFNGAMFAVGFTWALYGIVGAVVQTAHEGEVLGRRMSTIWFPIRMIIGVSGMVPVFGGFTLNQAVMMQLTIIGIGIGNAMWTEGLSRAASFTGLTSTHAFAPTVPSQIKEVAQTMFLGNLCVLAERNAQLAAQSAGVPPLPASEVPAVSVVQTPTSYTWRYGTPARPDKCATVVLLYGGGRNSSSSTGFRSGAVNYEAITTASDNAYRNYGNSLHQAMGTMAQGWYAQRNQALTSGGPMPEISSPQMDAAVLNFSASVSAQVDDASKAAGSAINASAMENMRRPGWIGAGAWFSTFAEINAGIADAGKRTSASSTFACGSSDRSAQCRVDTSHTIDVLNEASNAFAAHNRAKGLSSDGDSSKAILDSVIEDTGCRGGSFGNAIAGTATGNCSLGQGIVSAALRGTALGSGGGGGDRGLDSAGLVNPVIALKNMGDYIMSFSSGVLVASAGAAMFGGGSKAIGEGMASTGIPGVKQIGSFVSSKAEVVGKIGSWAASMAMLLLVLGAAMSVYLPMLPFITWMGSIVSYAASMIEGMAGMPLHSMAHMESDGEGMGQRTAHGYLFYVNALARPALMIIGFFVASALVIVIGTMQIKMFLPAMANAQGNSVTGLASILMFLVVYFVLAWTLIQSCFNLIYVITDQVLSFVGGQIAAKLGQDTEDKANNMFLVAARTGPGVVGAFARPKPQEDLKDRQGKTT